MRIAVTTPNGHVGHHLTRMLIRAGVRPLLLTRDPDRIAADLRPYVDIAQADSQDPEAIVAATRDVDALYWVDPSAFSDDPLADYARATEALVQAVRANGVRRVVFQSSVGAEKRHGVGEIDGLAGTEVALDALDIDVTHLRCGYFFTNLLLDVESLRAGTLATVLPLDLRMPWVAPRDISEVAALTLLNGERRGRRVQAVHGPTDLSWSEVAAILTRELGREVTVQRIDDEEMRQGLRAAGMPEAMAEAVLGMSTGLRDGFVAEQARSVLSTTPTTLEAWVREELVGVV
ncbi:NAD(P)H-binding protein [Microbacterium paraoxydans]|uniref:NmrA family NAD(P)-binding protein n=1 Tax=Microbacterium paraoxydans TaxID=199592 RepID=UPI0022864FBF|nr:NAD(P)H-binding protein [Microbacterium paraoxydans]MCZ0710920.1 NAD(P)H-binding protein [Microbacterium paraoxydans]